MVLSEPVGRLEGRRTYGTVPPRKRPALGRRDRPEQDFSAGLRPRDDRRTGTPDPCSAALHGRVLKAAMNNDAIESEAVTSAITVSEVKFQSDLIQIRSDDNVSGVPH